VRERERERERECKRREASFVRERESLAVLYGLA